MGWILGGAVSGVLVGAAIRHLLGRLRRGTAVRRCVAEFAAAVVLATGCAVAHDTSRLGLVTVAGVLLVALGLVDVAEHRLPDALTIPGLGLAIATVLVTEGVDPDAGSLLGAVAGGAVLMVAFAVLHRVSPRSMGRGDVKLVPSLGVLTGYLSLAVTLFAVFAAFLLGALFAVFGLASRRLTLKSAIPFGPFLLGGAWLALMVPLAGGSVS